VRIDPIEAYLQYLIQMSRKITSRGVHTNVLARKTKTTQTHYRSIDSQALPADKHQSYLKAVHEETVRGEGRSAFMCIGLIVGRIGQGNTARCIAAPLVMVPMDVWQDEDTAEYGWEPDWAEWALNYDLLTLLIERQVSPADEEDLAQVSDTLSASIRHCVTTAEVDLARRVASPDGRRALVAEPEVADQLFAGFQRDLLAFREIKPSAVAFDLKQLNQAFAGSAKWFNHRFYCMASLPNELSTFRALGSLLREMKEETAT
jgi:hypothetical protein